jgi:hypothetical protein
MRNPCSRTHTADPVTTGVDHFHAAETRSRSRGNPNPSPGIVLSADGRTIYNPWPLTGYDVATGTLKWQRPRLRGLVDIAITTKGDLIRAPAARTGRAPLPVIAVVDAHTGNTVRLMRGQAASNSPVFSRDGTLMSSASTNDRSSSGMWRAAPLENASRCSNSRRSSDSARGRTLYTGGGGGMLRVFDLSKPAI